MKQTFFELQPSKMSPLSEKLHAKENFSLWVESHIGVHTFSDNWAIQCMSFLKLPPAKCLGWLHLTSKKNHSLFFSTFFVYMKDVSQTFTLIITSKFEKDGLSRGIQVYTVLFWKATLLLEGVFSEISPFFSLNIAVNLKNDFKCELSSMILHNLVPIDPGNEIAKKKKLPMCSALPASKLFSLLCVSRLLSVGSYLQWHNDLDTNQKW